MYKRLFCILILCVFLLSGCESKTVEVPELLEPVNAKADTAVARLGDIYSMETYDGTVYPDTVEVHFTMDGVLSEMAVVPGQEVKKGEVLAILDDEPEQKELVQLTDELENMKSDNAYTSQQQGLDLQILRLQIKKLEAEQADELNIAKLQGDLEKLELVQRQTSQVYTLQIRQMEKRKKKIQTESLKKKLVAPCSGKVVYVKDIETGDNIKAYETLIVLADDSKLHIQGEYIQESVIKNASRVYTIINGTEYDIEYIPLDTSEVLDLKQAGKVPASSYSIEADHISAGDYACIYIKKNEKKNVITIPKKALYRDTAGYFVYKRQDDSYQKCNVEVGISTAIQVEITKGLRTGDVVYVQE